MRHSPISAEAFLEEYFTNNKGVLLRLKEIVAQWYYLKDETKDMQIVPFRELNSNVRDRYSRIAAGQLQQLMAGYLSNKGSITKLIRGCIKDFINAHSIELNRDNAESLVKRIISQLRSTKGGNC